MKNWGFGFMSAFTASQTKKARFGSPKIILNLAYDTECMTGKQVLEKIFAEKYTWLNSYENKSPILWNLEFQP